MSTVTTRFVWWGTQVVMDLDGNPELTDAQAASFITQAQNIEAALGC